LSTQSVRIPSSSVRATSHGSPRAVVEIGITGTCESDGSAASLPSTRTGRRLSGAENRNQRMSPRCITGTRDRRRRRAAPEDQTSPTHPKRQRALPGRSPAPAHWSQREQYPAAEAQLAQPEVALSAASQGRLPSWKCRPLDRSPQRGVPTPATVSRIAQPACTRAPAASSRALRAFPPRTNARRTATARLVFRARSSRTGRVAAGSATARAESRSFVPHGMLLRISHEV
jgi:hypothetical protein